MYSSPDAGLRTLRHNGNELLTYCELLHTYACDRPLSFGRFDRQCAKHGTLCLYKLLICACRRLPTVLQGPSIMACELGEGCPFALPVLIVSRVSGTND